VLETVVTTIIRRAAEGFWNSQMLRKTRQELLQRSNREWCLKMHTIFWT